MGLEGFIPQKRAGDVAAAANGASLPITASAGRPRVLNRQISKTFNNVKITILCLFITILVLRGTIGINLLTTQPEDEIQNLMEEANRVIADIRSEGKDMSDEPPMNPNVTFTFGYRISDCHERRRNWLKENPNFPSTLNGRRRMLLVSGSPLNPCDNPIGDHYLLKSIKNKITVEFMGLRLFITWLISIRTFPVTGLSCRGG